MAEAAFVLGLIYRKYTLRPVARSENLSVNSAGPRDSPCLPLPAAGSLVAGEADSAGGASRRMIVGNILVPLAGVPLHHEALSWALRGIDTTTGWQVEQLYDIAADVLNERATSAPCSNSAARSTSVLRTRPPTARSAPPRSPSARGPARATTRSTRRSARNSTATNGSCSSPPTPNATPSKSRK